MSSIQGLKKDAELAIIAYDSGNYDDFINKSKLIYNSFASFNCPLKEVENPYLLGIVYSYLADYYENNIDIYTSIVENASYCFSKVLKEIESESEIKCSAIRLLILSFDNERVIKHIFYKFVKNGFGKNSYDIAVWASVEDFLKGLREYCLYIVEKEGKQAYISEEYMRKFNQLSQGIQKSMYTEQGIKSGFDWFYKNISEVIATPYDRRITVLF